MWTDDQLKAINAPVSDILVTAAAGSGKTAVMVERLIQRIIADNGTDIDKILVVTFTKAAASEIKERIVSKITQQLEINPSQHLKNQLVLINRASICTIHSFCLDVLKNNFHLLDLDPNFKVGDTSEIALLKAKALNDTLDKYYEDDDADFLRLVNSFTKRNDSALGEIIMNMYNFSQSEPHPDKFLDECADIYSGNFIKHINYILNNVSDDAKYCAGIYEKALNLCKFDAAFEKCVAIISDELDLCNNIIKLCPMGWDRVYGYINDYKFATMRSNKNMDSQVYEEVKTLRNIARGYVKNIIGHLVYMPLSQIEEDLLYMRPCVLKLCRIVKDFSALYSQYKRERNIVDFNDFEHLALKLLLDSDHPEVSENLRNRYEEIYVDEYQDCNGVQEAVFKAVSREVNGAPNMFMVGDMKQCIYRFRNANPQLFKFKSDTYTDGDYKKIILSKNFRSRTQVLEGANIIFGRVMSECVGELNYTEEEKLVYGADYDNKNEDTEFIDIDIVDASGEFEDDDDEKPAKIEAEASMVARKIRNMADSGYLVFDKGTNEYRPIKYRDIAILLRSRSGSAEYFADALSKQGIPTFCDTGAGYFDCEEVATLISFVKIISNPLDDVNLVSILRSPLYRFTDNELLKIRTAHRDGYYYDSLLKYANSGDSLSFKVKAFLKALDKYNKKASVMATDEFLWYLTEDTDYMEYIGTLAGASLKKANVRTLINSAHQFDKSFDGGISKFADYVTQISLSGGGGSEAKLIGENDDVVRIMTIHKSKGLEFPVVFVSQCGKKFFTRDLSASVLLHHELGLGIDYVDEQKRFSYKTTVKDAIKEKCLSENLSEEMRLLYVAMTRAKEKLVITGVVDNYSKFREKLDVYTTYDNGRLSPKSVSVGRCYLDWVMAATGDEDKIFRTNVVSIYSLNDDFAQIEKADIEIPKKNEHSDYKPEILRRLTWEYPYAKLSGLPRNVSVTEIKRIHDTDDSQTYRLYRMPQLKKPAFLNEDAIVTAANIGTLMHLCMEKIKLTDGINSDTIKEEIALFVRDGIITEENAKYIDIDAIDGFFRSNLGKAMVSSGDVCRETPFEILVEANDIFENADTDEKIVVQGMIDAYFTDADGNVILVDYKTDRRGDRKPAEFRNMISERYRLQMDYYEKAIKIFTGKNVYRRCIYLFDTGEIVDV